MIAAIISIISLLALLQFFVSYCYPLMEKSLGHQLSAQAREITGMAAKTVATDQFQRILLLIALCPRTGGEDIQVGAFSWYFKTLGFVRVFFTWAPPAAAQWLEAKRGGGIYAAAVVLDR